MYDGDPALEPAVNGRHKIYQKSWENSMQLRRITVRVIPRWWWYIRNLVSFLVF